MESAATPEVMESEEMSFSNTFVVFAAYWQTSWLTSAQPVCAAVPVGYLDVISVMCG